MVDFEYPVDELAERAVLGAMIKDPESIPTVLEHLREEDFYFETHRLLFSVLYKVWEDKGKDWDDIVLKGYLEGERVGGQGRYGFGLCLSPRGGGGTVAFGGDKKREGEGGIKKANGLIH
jgi:Replicative DNA helicase